MTGKIDTSKIKKILVTRTDRIGDVLITTPVFRALREAFPKAYIAVMVLPSTKELVDGNPYVDEVIVYDKRGKEKSWLSTLNFALELGERKFDLAIHLHPTNRVHYVSFFAGIPVRLGYRRKNHFILTHKIEDRKREGLRHEAEYNFDLLNLIGVNQPDELELYFPLKEADRDRLNTLLKDLGYDVRSGYFVVNPSASCPSKVWSPHNFARVADSLSRENKWKTVLIGGIHDRFQSLLVSDFMEEEAIDLTGKLSLGMLGWIMNDARILISNDSGPVHVAVALGRPVVSIFGRNQAGLSPVRWRPLGKKSAYIQRDVGCIRCSAHDCEISFRCLQEVKVDDVLAEARKIVELHDAAHSRAQNEHGNRKGTEEVTYE